MIRISSIAIALGACLMFACSGSTPEGTVGESGDELSRATPWCNSGHTADAEEGNFNGFGGHTCGDTSAKAQCGHLGGKWCKGFVDNQILLCACKK